MICAIYPRKSKKDDNSQSMETQISMCKEYIATNFPNAQTVIYDKDYDITGHSIKRRKDFQRMMDDISKGLVNLVLIQRYDRIARNTRDFCNMYHDMEIHGCELVSVSQRIDTSTPYGRKFMYDLASTAELEWALCSERHKDVNKYARITGKCNLSYHSIPLGYKAEKIDGIRRMVKNDEEAPIIEYVINELRLGTPKLKIVKDVNKIFEKNFTKQFLNTFCKSSFYYGEYRENDHFCEPYLTKEEWLKITAPKDTKPRFHNTDSQNMLFTGIIKCPLCNCRLDPLISGTYLYYRCGRHYSIRNCTFKKNISEHKIEEYLLNNIDLQIDNMSRKITPISKGKKVVNKDYKEELKRLNNMYLKGRISESEYDSEYNRINELIALSLNTNEHVSDIKTIRDNFPSDWKDIYNKLNKSNKKKFWLSVIEEIKINENAEFEGIIFRR